ncbi:type III-B CRISPR module RAMP protein Cmr6 [Bacteroidetes/Chlorobi group bacterium Naka2016]|jgi:CRISPR-associated protein Cmr6|nr:MAG: type III-B CRISPR module RAMP protein Cmr6 [Bacteroidetes/Chlorobi group bacterium Naka2016]
MSVKIPETNKYFPEDTKIIISSIKTILETQFEKFNFNFFFNLPKINEDNRHLPAKIRINENIQNFKWDTKFTESIIDRLKKTAENLKQNSYSIKSFQATCHWRLIIGLGASHPQETSMTLHHIYGIPYIPGGAVKGVTRHWFIFNEFNSLGISNFEQINCFEKILETVDIDNKDENKRDYKISKEDFKKKFKVKKSNELIEPNDNLYEFLITKHDTIRNFQSIFGTQNKKGDVIFFDAYPVGKINLKIDTMNPHYPDYYSKGAAPADWQNPNPIKFLTVENTKFQFWLASRDADLLDEAENLLKRAIREYGIGAKTSLGYGIFGGI